MADLNSLYSKFNDKISLTTSKRDSLQRGRDALRDIIKTDFSKEERNKPKFRMQGSFAYKTTINPLEDNEFDLDDGVYLQGYGDLDKDDWPAAKTTHQWIIDAVNGHTKSEPENKTSCIRVQYEAGYHIDLPIYIIKNDVCYLANKSSGWIESDPKAFKEWFMNYVLNYPYTYGEQLRSTVKYVKAWRDYCNVDLASIVITILVTNNFSSYSGRDDRAVYETIYKMYTALSIVFSCKKPVSLKEELLSDYSDKEKEVILDALKVYMDISLSAIQETDEKIASEKLREIYGTRFPLGTASQNSNSGSKYVRTSSPGIIGNDGRSA